MSLRLNREVLPKIGLPASRMQPTLTAFVLALSGDLAWSQSLPDYRCVIERIETAASAPNATQNLHEGLYLGREFTVERRTGVMAGALKNSYVTQPQVIDLGSADNSFKVSTTMRQDQGAGRGSNAYLLVVNEYARGAKKPYVFMENDIVYFGTCVHF